MKLISIGILCFLTLGCTSTDYHKHLQTRDGSFEYNLTGSGDTTLVFESGLGDDMSSWTDIAHLLSDKTKVFTYNRAGFANNTSKNKDRNGATIVEELRQILETAEVDPPYILVGHSLGGAYMELYTRNYPDEVAGLVLIDTNSSKYPESCRKKNLGYCEPPSSMPWYASIFYPSAVKSEIEGFRTTHQQINEISSFPSIPLAVLSSTNEEGLNEQQLRRRKLNKQMHKNLSALSPTSRFIECDTCGHYVHKDNPQMVVENILWVLESSKVDRHNMHNKALNSLP